jgi:hypothetical protein
MEGSCISIPDGYSFEGNTILCGERKPLRKEHVFGASFLVRLKLRPLHTDLYSALSEVRSDARAETMNRLESFLQVLCSVAIPL